MASGLTVFCTYQFEGAAYSSSESYGYQTPIHCNYIQKAEIGSLAGKALNMFFSSTDDFPFLADSNSIDGTGFTATKINALVQVVSGISDNNITITPDPALWKKYDVTNQIVNHNSGEAIKKENLVNTLFTIDLTADVPYYDLSYVNYPPQLQKDSNGHYIYPSIDKLAFGEEVLFFGSVETDIKATAYTTEIPVVLSLNQYNSTTNPTWDGVSKVYITEVGIYDANNNLVAIGKLNTPISKDSGIARTILFGLDF